MAKSLVDYIFRYMATKFLNRDEQDAVGVINRQMTLTEATPISGEGAAAATTPSAAGATPSGAAPAPATSSPATVSSESTQPTVDESATSGSASSATQDQAPAEGANATPADTTSGLMDGLKIVARNGEADASREERLNAGQAPVIFDTADSPACTECGSIMVRNGSCYKCINCGATSGCS
jgi:ribonucleoside-diphosphate reductase alpha chain